jgi:hypothetical protein
VAIRRLLAYGMEFSHYRELEIALLFSIAWEIRKLGPNRICSSLFETIRTEEALAMSARRSFAIVSLAVSEDERKYVPTRIETVTSKS